MKTKTTKTATVTVAPINADLNGIAIRVVRAADKMGLRPADVLVAPTKLAAHGIDPATVTADVIAAATIIDRHESRELLGRAAELNSKLEARRNPKPVATNSDVPAARTVVTAKQPSEAKAARETNAEPKTRIKIMGFAVTAVLRWMGAKSWSFEDAATAITTLGATDISDVTIRLQLKAGKDGKRGSAAEITSAQAKKLKAASV